MFAHTSKVKDRGTHESQTKPIKADMPTCTMGNWRIYENPAEMPHYSMQPGEPPGYALEEPACASRWEQQRRPS